MGSQTSRSRRAKALSLLRELSLEPLSYQADAAVRCLDAIEQRGKLLIQSPTGTGKTLISQLMAALLALEQPRRIPRVLVVVPTRTLLWQHVRDAAWLRLRLGLALHALHAEIGYPLFMSLLRSYGILVTTPVTIATRLRAASPDVAKDFDCVVFDEIDTYLTATDLQEREDTWPALEAFLEAGIPILGFTGTHLSEKQLGKWVGHGFEQLSPEVPREWLPFTKVRFMGILDSAVARHDESIRNQLRAAYRQLKNQLGVHDPAWSRIKELAAGGNVSALAILRLSAERLQLFESAGPSGLKYARIAELAKKRGPTLLFSRFRESARRLQATVREAGVSIDQLDGSMPRMKIEEGMHNFRFLSPNKQHALVITRDLGGRGLDFPNARRAVAISPRSNYQTVAQELARIRSRPADAKQATILYFSQTAEQGKAHRLSQHLRGDKYADHSLFQILDPPTLYDLESFESRNLRNEEALPDEALMRTSHW